MYRSTDRLTLVNLDVIRYSLARHCFLRIGGGISVRARETPQGYVLALRLNQNYSKGVTVPITTRLYSKVRNGTPFHTRRICCSKCGRNVHGVYIDWDTLTALCRTCAGVPPSVSPPKPASCIDMMTDSRFRKILRRIFIMQAIEAERIAINTQKPDKFFEERPYLIPPILSLARAIDLTMYNKVLKDLRHHYRTVLSRWKGINIREEDRRWATDELERRLTNGFSLTFTEAQWMKEQYEWLKSKRSTEVPSPLTLPNEIGPPSGTARVPSSSPPMGTASSSSRTPSSPGTSADPATVPGESPVTTATGAGPTVRTAPILSVASVMAKEGPNVRSAKVRALYLSYLTSLNAVPPPDES